MQRAIVLCQGEQSRLATLGHPKQLLQVGQETILGRTLRLLRNARWPTVVIGTSALLHEADRHEAMLYTLRDLGFCVLDALAQLGELFSGADVRVFLGDVIWSPLAFSAFLNGNGRPFFFAGTPGIDSGQGELFGLGFSQIGLPTIGRLVRDAPCRRVIYEHGQPGHLRNLLFSASADFELPPRQLYANDLLIPVTDWTCDVDKPEDLDRLPALAEYIARDG